MVSYDTICILVEHENSSTKLQKEAKYMKRVFTTNWHINRVCRLSISAFKVQCDISEKRSTLESRLHRHDFRKLLLEAVDEVFSSSLGDSAKRAIYFHLQKTFKIRKQEIPNKIDEFANAIEKIFGDGAKLLEIRIMKHLYEKVGNEFGYFPEEDALLFTEYVKAALYQTIIV